MKTKRLILLLAAAWLGAGLMTAPRPAQAALPTKTQEAKLSPHDILEALAKNPTGADADKLADQIRQVDDSKQLSNGVRAIVEGLRAAWIIDAPSATTPPQIVSTDGNYRFTLHKLGGSSIYALAQDLPSGAGMVYDYLVNGQKKMRGQFEVYADNPENHPNPNAPHGMLTTMPIHHSQVFPNVTHEWWVYVPAQYKAENPACVMVFQDGGGYKNYIPAVFDNLIAKGDMPVTVGIFIQPGVRADGSSERSFEYDTLSDQYARFLIDEILPETEKTVKLRHDGASRGVAGLSSGGICAFTVAWERPDQFSKVLSWIGSFTGIASGKTLKEGGNNYPVMIRKTRPVKPIRVFLQDGSNDLDNEHGSWPLANQEMARALAFSGYDYRFVFGQGFHSDPHGRSILPDSLRWLWREYKPGEPATK